MVEREPEELRVGGSTPSNLTKTKKMQLYLVIKNNPLIFALENNTGVWRSGSAADCTQSNSLKRIVFHVSQLVEGLQNSNTYA